MQAQGTKQKRTMISLDKEKYMVDEKRFRYSQIARALGYPISYQIVSALLKRGRMSLNEISSQVKRSKADVCYHLSNLRRLNIVRHESNGRLKKGKMTLYWLNCSKNVRQIISSIEKFCKKASKI